MIMGRSILKNVIFLFVCLAMGCGQSQESPVEPDTTRVTDAEIEKVAGKKVLFAHMSVGNNILQGIDELKARDSRFNKINVIEYSEGIAVETPGIYHFLIGDNSFPEKKIQSCFDILSQRELGTLFDALILKFCYVDIMGDAEPEALFSGYSRFVDSVKRGFPDLEIVHVTVPLTVRYQGIKGWLKFHLSREPGNEKRSIFNRKMIETFGKDDLVYDLARLEALDSRGKELFYMSRGQKVNYLAGEYTDDGGHLNAAGRKKAAMELVKILGRLD